MSTVGASGRLNQVTGRGARRGFTPLETLVVMTIISMLVGLLLPAISGVRRSMKLLRCTSNMRSIVVEFQLFVDGNSAKGQGDSEKLGRNRFYINDFQDSMYDLDEFWDLGPAASGTLRSDKSTMLCPEGPSDLTKRKGFPCGSEALGPPENVTLAMNMRLYRGVVHFGGASLLAPAAVSKLRANILNHPYVPLIMDVDGQEAAKRGLDPFYMAPPIPGADDPYSDGRYWMPSFRHGEKVNIAFVGGHVLTSSVPEEEDWNWSFQVSAGN